MEIGNTCRSHAIGQREEKDNEEGKGKEEVGEVRK